MKKQLFLFVSIFLTGILTASAQNAPIAVKQISGGVLNGKAVSLAKPVYPAAARAVGAAGAVNVKVTVDEEGNVISTEAVSGHPLLQEAAKQAAQQSKFNPTLLSGQAVKVTGIIVYNFSAPEKPTNWLKIGYDLTSVQHAPSLIHLDTNSIDKIFQADWTVEREQLKRLGEIKEAEGASMSPPIASGERKISDTAEKTANGTTVRKVVKEFAIKTDTPPNSEQVAVSESLIVSLQSRLVFVSDVI
jgi:TonB family protein